MPAAHGHGSPDSHGEQKVGHGAGPSSKKRGCTDIPCLFVFIVAIIGLGVCLGVAAGGKGNLDRITHSHNFKGQLCGVDVVGRYAFFCMTNGNGGGTTEMGAALLDASHPICVIACSDGNSAQNCPGGLTSTYASSPFAGRYCMPNDKEQFNQVMVGITRGRFGYITNKLATLQGAVLPLAISVAIGILLGYVFLYLLDTCIKPVVWSCLVIMILVPSLLGVYLIWSSQYNGDLRDAYKGKMALPSTGDKDTDLQVGIGLCVAGAIFILMACCSHHAIEVACDCIEVSSDCMFDMPSLLFGPIVELVTRIVLNIPLIIGFFLMASATTVEYSNDPSIGGEFQAVERYKYEDYQVAMLVFYVFMIVWVNELIHGMTQFAIAFAVQAWYYCPYNGKSSKQGVPSLALFTGYITVTMYHFGTVCFGSCLIAIFRFPVLILGYIENAAKQSGPIGDALAKCCTCCMECIEQIVMLVSKNAYMACCINSTNFCESASVAVQVLQDPAVAMLNGMTWLIQLAGVGSITCGCAALTFLMCTSIPTFKNLTGNHFVVDPIFISVAAGFLALPIAISFMLVFDMVVDTIFFCYSNEHAQIRTVEDAGHAKSDPLQPLFACCGTDARRVKPKAPLYVNDYTPPKMRQIIAINR